MILVKLLMKVLKGLAGKYHQPNGNALVKIFLSIAVVAKFATTESIERMKSSILIFTI